MVNVDQASILLNNGQLMVKWWPIIFIDGKRCNYWRIAVTANCQFIQFWYYEIVYWVSAIFHGVSKQPWFGARCPAIRHLADQFDLFLCRNRRSTGRSQKYLYKTHIPSKWIIDLLSDHPLVFTTVHNYIVIVRRVTTCCALWDPSLMRGSLVEQTHEQHLGAVTCLKLRDSKDKELALHECWNVGSPPKKKEGLPIENNNCWVL